MNSKLKNFLKVLLVMKIFAFSGFVYAKKFTFNQLLISNLAVVTDKYNSGIVHFNQRGALNNVSHHIYYATKVGEKLTHKERIFFQHAKVGGNQLYYLQFNCKNKVPSRTADNGVIKHKYFMIDNKNCELINFSIADANNFDYLKNKSDKILNELLRER